MKKIPVNVSDLKGDALIYAMGAAYVNAVDDQRKKNPKEFHKVLDQRGKQWIKQVAQIDIVPLPEGFPGAPMMHTDGLEGDELIYALGYAAGKRAEGRIKEAKGKEISMFSDSAQAAMLDMVSEFGGSEFIEIPEFLVGKENG